MNNTILSAFNTLAGKFNVIISNICALCMSNGSQHHSGLYINDDDSKNGTYSKNTDNIFLNVTLSLKDVLIYRLATDKNNSL